VEGDHQHPDLRGVVSHQAELDEDGADQRLDDEKNSGADGPGAGPMADGREAKHGYREAQNEEAIDSAREAMGELNQGFGIRRARNDLAVAGGPVLTAPCAGAGHPNPCTEEDDADGVEGDQGCELPESREAFAGLGHGITDLP
jgi:hypothetical protein